MKKNIFDKFQDYLVLQMEKFEKREDKDVLKKIPFWLIFFFPYAIYLLLFKTRINKFIKALAIIFIACSLIIGFDVALYPNRVYDKVCKDSYSIFVSENKELKLREPLYVSKVSDFKINDDLYFGFDIFDNVDMYYGIFKIDSFNKDYKLVSLYDIDFNFANVYSVDKFKSVRKIHPVILSFILSSGSDINLNNMTAITDVKEKDLLDNLINQDIKINNKAYSFEFNDFEVLKIKDSKDKVLYENSYNTALNNYMPNIVRNLLIKNFDSNYNLTGYNYINNTHYFYLKVANKDYAVKYIPGVDAELLLIDNPKEFKEYILDLIVK